MELTVSRHKCQYLQKQDYVNSLIIERVDEIFKYGLTLRYAHKSRLTVCDSMLQFT